MTKPLRIAIVHYHLRPGGVTRVIQHAVSALAYEDMQVVVLTGEPPEDALRKYLPHIGVIDGLGYSDTVPSQTAQMLVQQMETAVKTALGGPPDLWHIHNHALGKNLALPEIVSYLAQIGKRVLLQLHDFAEDGRPENYRFLLQTLGQGDHYRLGMRLYPQAAHVHYALLNSRDYSFLAASGVLESQLHLLPNAVWMGSSSLDHPLEVPSASQRLFLYPTRAIRRKNLGEFLFWSALGEKGDRFATTLAPQNPLARPVYERWVAFARAQHLPVEFALGSTRSRSLSPLLCSAYALMTTSVAEGFGLAFLEPWLVGRMLVGRNLPEITEELSQAGVNLSGLYRRLDVPVEWIGRKAFYQKMVSAQRAYLESYGRKWCPEDAERAMSAAVAGDHVDFGRLDESFQEQVISRVVQDLTMRKNCRPSSLETGHDRQALIQQNRQVVRYTFGLASYGKRLTKLYHQILESPVEPLSPLSADVLLDQFLTPERFSLLWT